MTFILVVLAIWVLIAILLKKRMGEHFKISSSLLPLVLFSYLVTIDLGINYLAGAIPGLNDGIGLHSKFAFYIIGDDGWSVELFKKIYDISFGISLILTLVFIGSLFVNHKKIN